MVEGFALVDIKKVDANDLLQLSRQTKPSTWTTMLRLMCLKSNESFDHLLLHCSIALEFWHRFFHIDMIDWVNSREIAKMSGICIEAFGSLPKGEFL